MSNLLKPTTENINDSYMEYCATGNWRDFYLKLNSKEKALSYIFIGENRTLIAECKKLSNVNIQNESNFHDSFSTPYKVILIDSNSKNTNTYQNLISSMYEDEELFAVIIFGTSKNSDSLIPEIKKYNNELFPNRHISIYEVQRIELENPQSLELLVIELFNRIIKTAICDFIGNSNAKINILEYLDNNKKEYENNFSWEYWFKEFTPPVQKTFFEKINYKILISVISGILILILISILLLTTHSNNSTATSNTNTEVINPIEANSTDFCNKETATTTTPKGVISLFWESYYEKNTDYIPSLFTKTMDKTLVDSIVSQSFNLVNVSNYCLVINSTSNPNVYQSTVNETNNQDNTNVLKQEFTITPNKTGSNYQISSIRNIS